MSLTYIAGYDGTPASRSAVQLAVELAGPAHAHVVAAHVYPLVPPLHAPGASAVADHELQEDARRRAKDLLEGLDVEGVERRVLACGSPAHGLHDLAEHEDASLLSVGVTHHGPVGRLAPGSVAAKLLHGAPCPVMAVPAAEQPSDVRVIGVAYDGRRESRRALLSAQRLATALGARLVLIGCYESPALAGPIAGAGDLEPALFEDFSRDLEAAAARLSGLDVETLPVRGLAGKALAEASARVDLLVTGSRSYGPVRSVLLGSVSRHLVDHATCPVLVVPRSTNAELDREPERVDAVTA